LIHSRCEVEASKVALGLPGFHRVAAPLAPAFSRPVDGDIGICAAEIECSRLEIARARAVIHDDANTRRVRWDKDAQEWGVRLCHHCRAPTLRRAPKLSEAGKAPDIGQICGRRCAQHFVNIGIGNRVVCLPARVAGGGRDSRSERVICCDLRLTQAGELRCAIGDKLPAGYRGRPRATCCSGARNAAQKPVCRATDGVADDLTEEMGRAIRIGGWNTQRFVHHRIVQFCRCH